MTRKKWAWGARLAVLLAAGSIVWWLASSFIGSESADPHSEDVQELDSRQVERGRAIYQANCAQCHGANAEGQPFWEQRNPDGSLKPPPHDSTGHTWHHSDGLLYRIIRDGGTIYQIGEFKSNMPAFGDRLNPEEIQAVITYFKSLWTPEIRSSQAEISERDPFP